jgi:polysaccharide pyruvyl transferase WcaK-like protein
MVKRVYITGYYHKDNTGDDIFEKIARRLFVSGKSVEFFINPIDELKKYIDKSPKVFDSTDSIILFGGETLNDYFLKTLATIKSYNQSIKMYAIGVGLGADIDYLKYYLPMFNYIIVRHQYDYEKIKSRFPNIPCMFVQDIVFMYQIKGYKQKTVGKNPHVNPNTIGLFLSQPKYFALNKNKDAQEILLNSYMSIVNNYIRNGYSVKLFSMCYNNIESESDMVLNNLILLKVESKNKSYITVVPSKAFEANLLTLKYAVCERFHSHILCMIYNIPFVSLANTLKVNHLLHDLGLENTILTISDDVKERVRGSRYGQDISEPVGSLGSSVGSNGSGLSSFSLYSIYNFEYDSIHNKLLEIEKMKKTLKNIYKNTYPIVENFYNKIMNNQQIRNDIDYLFLSENKEQNKELELYSKNRVPVYISYPQALIHCNRILNDIQHPRNIKNLADYVLMKIFGTNNLDYKWGIEEKMKHEKFDLEQIKWLFEKSMMEHRYLFNYFTNQFIQNFKNKEKVGLGLFNIDYIDQYDRTGAHRHGWKYVVDNFSHQLCSYHPNLIKCDMYVDRTFHWAKRDLLDAGVIPYRSPWVGIIHHTMYKDASGYNSIELLKCPEFLSSLKHCKGLIVLSNCLKLKLNKLASHNKINLPHITVIHHPGFFVDESKLWRFGSWKLSSWKGEVIQIGSWMRDLKAIFDLKYKKKFALIGKEMKDKYKEISFGDNPINFDDFENQNIKKIENKKENNDENKTESPVNVIDKFYPVKILKYADNETYDEILSRYVVFIKLHDASAVNTIIECITRNTPIIVNRLPAVEEYLGSNYPLLYDSIDEVPRMLNNYNLIINANTYLKKMNKDFLKIETFIKEMEKLHESLRITVTKD